MRMLVPRFLSPSKLPAPPPPRQSAPRLPNSCSSSPTTMLWLSGLAAAAMVSAASPFRPEPLFIPSAFSHYGPLYPEEPALTLEEVEYGGCAVLLCWVTVSMLQTLWTGK